MRQLGRSMTRKQRVEQFFRHYFPMESQLRHCEIFLSLNGYNFDPAIEAHVKMMRKYVTWDKHERTKNG